jgi:hypothetical protein
VLWSLRSGAGACDRQRRELSATGDAGLLEDVLQMVLHGPGREEELARDRLRRPAEDRELGNLALRTTLSGPESQCSVLRNCRPRSLLIRRCSHLSRRCSHSIRRCSHLSRRYRHHSRLSHRDGVLRPLHPNTAQEWSSRWRKSLGAGSAPVGARS